MNTDSLTDLMATHWTDTLGNVPNDALRASWRQAFNTFDRKIAEQSTPFAADWHVLSPATGAGKSESLKLYAAERSKGAYDGPPGILIVVRLIAQANEFVADINARAGESVAVARHSDCETPLEDLAGYPVLVITHAAFSGRPRHSADLWSQYMTFMGDRRRLVVIDEAVDVLDIARIDADLISKLYGAIPTAAQRKWPAGYRAIGKLRQLFRDIDNLPEEQTREARVLLTTQRREYLSLFEKGWQGADEAEAIREYMRSDAHRYLLGKRRVDGDAESRQKRIYDKLFADLLAIYDSFILHHKAGTKATLNTATRILPDDGQGCVVLDATADTNPIYECMERDTYNVIKHPAITCRVYGNATLRASFGHSVGRTSLVRTKDGKEPGARIEAPKLFAALAEEHDRRATTGCPMERVLIVCHKDAKPHLEGFATPFEYDLAHYGALDGRNDWNGFDSVLIFGLDYRHPADAPTSFLALQPEHQSDAWFQDPAKRAFKGYADIRSAIDNGIITSSVIQAVNRVRTRRVIDTEGNCPDSFVYMLLPGDRIGKDVYETLQSQMPGIAVDSWSYEGAKSVPRSKHEASLMRLVESLSAGESWSATDLKRHLGIPASSWDRLVPKLNDETTALGQRARELGVGYQTRPTARGVVAHLVKR